ncbi:unnamed protein product [Rhodiola kirilowii]
MKRDCKKTVTISTSTSSSTASATSTTTTAMEPDRSEPTKDSSCYFPGCRKDANCSCEICLASINATLDLMPLSIKKPNLNSRPSPTTPISFDSPSVMSNSTPRISIIGRRARESPPPSPCWKSTARVGPKDAAAAKALLIDEDDVRRNNRSKFGKLTILGFVMLIFGMELGLPWVVSKTLIPELSAEIVRDLGQRAFAVNDMNGKLRMLRSELQRSVHARVSNCSYNTPVWEINQDGLLLSSRCVLFKSATEQVTIWGWPLQTAGLLASRFSSRSFIVLSGRVTQWPDGNAGYLTMKARESWVQDKYRASAVQLDRQTWVLEYSRSTLLENKGLLCSAVWEFFKYRLSRAYVSKTSTSFGWLAARIRGYSAVDSLHAHPT